MRRPSIYAAARPVCLAGVGLLFSLLSLSGPARAEEPGMISTVAGSDTYGYSGDGGPATSAKLNYPERVIVDGAHNLYIADSKNHVIRRVDASTKIITTVAGNGKAGFSGDGGPATAAQLNYPTGMAFDSKGDLYIADRDNNRVRKVTLGTGVITTVAGTGDAGFAGDDGPATQAALNHPRGLAFDNIDTLFIADTDNVRVRKVTGGVIGTVMARTSPGSDLYPIYFIWAPYDIAVDKAMNLSFSAGGYVLNGDYPGDTIDHRTGQWILTSLYDKFFFSFAFDNNGNIVGTDGAKVIHLLKSFSSSTIARSDGGFSTGDGRAITASLSEPHGVAVDSDGTIYVADSGNNLVRKITAIPPDVVQYALRIVSIGGVGIPSNNVGSATKPDVILPSNIDANNIPVRVEGYNLPDGTTVRLFKNDVAVGTGDGSGNFNVSATPNPDSGPLAITVLKAVATVTITPTIIASLPKVKGLQLDTIEIMASLGGASKTEYLSKDGRRFTYAQLSAMARAQTNG